MPRKYQACFKIRHIDIIYAWPRVKLKVDMGAYNWGTLSAKEIGQFCKSIYYVKNISTHSWKCMLFTCESPFITNEFIGSIGFFVILFCYCLTLLSIRSHHWDLDNHFGMQLAAINVLHSLQRGIIYKN